METLIIVLVVLVVYCYPSINATVRNVPNQGSVVVINLFLGWTLIGWVVALAMSARDPKPAPPQLPVLTQPRDRAAARDWWKR